MKLILPVAGKGTRMRPLTHTVAKTLIPIAGKPALAHIIDNVLATQGIEVTEIIFIYGHLGEQIREWAEATYDIPLCFVEQKVQNGSGDAIRLAEPFVNGEDMLIIFTDTLFDADLEAINDFPDADGIIWAQEVEDPRRFGVVEHDEEGWMTGLVEKPEEPTSNLVNIGMYYIRDSKSIFSFIDVLFEEEIKSKGEYNFPEALDLMAKNGKKLKVEPVEKWMDTGVPATTLATNWELCQRIGKENSIHETARIERSTLLNCIVMEGAQVMDCDLKDSLIGPRAVIKHTKGTLRIGSDAYVDGNDNKKEE